MKKLLIIPILAVLALSACGPPKQSDINKVCINHGKVISVASANKSGQSAYVVCEDGYNTKVTG